VWLGRLSYDRDATDFAQAFYGELGRGSPVSRAAAVAHRALLEILRAVNGAVTSMSIANPDLRRDATAWSPMARDDISFHPFGRAAALFDPATPRVFALGPAEALAWCLLSEAGATAGGTAKALARSADRPVAEAEAWLDAALAQWRDAGLLGVAPAPRDAVAWPVSDTQITQARSAPALPRAASAAGLECRRYRLFDTVIEVAFAEPGLAAAADAILGAVRCGTPAQFQAALAPDGDGWTVVAGGQVAERAASRAQAIPALKLALARLALSRVNGIGAVHAAAVAHCGRAVLLPAPAGAGKSTLAAGCAFMGWEMIADDTVVLDGPAECAVLRPLPLASCLKAGSWLPLADLGADLEPLCVHERLDGRQARYLPAPLPAESPAPVAAIVIVRWQESGRSPAQLVRMSPLQAFEALMPQLYPLERPFDAALVRYGADLVAQTPCFALEYSVLREGIARLAEACRS
jgi:hypothetical protein